MNEEPFGRLGGLLTPPRQRHTTPGRPPNSDSLGPRTCAKADGALTARPALPSRAAVFVLNPTQNPLENRKGKTHHWIFTCIKPNWRSVQWGLPS